MSDNYSLADYFSARPSGTWTGNGVFQNKYHLPQFSIPAPASQQAPQTSQGGGPDNTTQFDPFGLPVGQHVGDLSDVLSSYFAPHNQAAQGGFDPGAIPSFPYSMPVPIDAPASQGARKIGTVSAGESTLGTLQPGGPSTTDPFTQNYNFDFSNWLPSGADYSHILPGGNVADTTDYSGQIPDYSSAPSKSNPFDSSGGLGDTAKRLGLSVASNFLPGGGLMLAGYNAASSGYDNYNSARDGTLAPQHSLFHQIFNPAETIGGLIGTSLGQNAGLRDSSPVLNNPGATAAGASYPGMDGNAILNGAYGYTPGKDASLDSVKGQAANLPGGGSPTFDNTQMGWTGAPMQNLGGVDIFNMIGANPLSWADHGGAGTGPSVDDVNRWTALNSSGNRWDN